MKKLLISGGNGNYAKEIIKQNTEYEVYAPTRSEMDITDLDAVKEVVKTFQPDIFLHPAALTRPMVIHTENPELSINSNIIGTSNIVLACIESGIKLVYISTDYVYPGTVGDYKEEDPLYPVNFYAWSKLGGECAVRLYENSLILRVCMTERPFVHKKALVDSYKSLMYIEEAAHVSLKLFNEFGVINVGGDPTNSYDFVRKNEGLSPDKIYREDIPEPMASNSTMNLDRLRNRLKLSIGLRRHEK